MTGQNIGIQHPHESLISGKLTVYICVMTSFTPTHLTFLTNSSHQGFKCHRRAATKDPAGDQRGTVALTWIHTSVHQHDDTIRYNLLECRYIDKK